MILDLRFQALWPNTAIIFPHCHNTSAMKAGKHAKGKYVRRKENEKDIAHFPFGLWTRTISLRKSKMSVLEIIYRWQVFENFEFKISREWTQFRILRCVISKDTFKSSEKLFRNLADFRNDFTFCNLSSVK